MAIQRVTSRIGKITKAYVVNSHRRVYVHVVFSVAASKMQCDRIPVNVIARDSWEPGRVHEFETPLGPLKLAPVDSRLHE